MPDEHKIAQARLLRQQGKPYRYIMRETGLNARQVQRAIKGIDSPSDDKQEGWSESGETAVWSGFTSKPIRNDRDLIEQCKIDLTVWFVDRVECVAWNTTVRDADKSIRQTQNYRVKVYLRRIYAKFIQQAQEAIDKRRQKYSPKYPKAYKSKGKGEYCGVIGLFDVHFGKLAWHRDTENNYDLDIAEQRFDKAVEELLDHSRGKSISSWLLPIGNDYFHIDNSKNTTYAGTPQDVDGRYAKIYETGTWAMIRAIDRLLLTAPVDVLYVPGNHDPTTSYHLCREIKTHYRLVDSVNVDVEPTSRKYYSYGKSLLGFTHGDKIKPDKLPNLMAKERREDHSKATCTDWFIGHLHCRKAWMSKPVDTFEGSTIRVIKSLSGTDSWHYDNGYIDDQQAAEVYFYHKDSGYAGHWVARASK